MYWISTGELMEHAAARLHAKRNVVGFLVPRINALP
jgi:hypothetical protein